MGNTQSCSTELVGRPKNTWHPAMSANAPNEARAPPRFITLTQTTDRTGFSRSYLYELIAAGEFPRPVKLGLGKRAPIRFVESEVDAWIESKIAQRDQNLRPVA